MAELNRVWVVRGGGRYDDHEWIEAITLSEGRANEIVEAKTKEYADDASYFRVNPYEITK